MSIDFRPNMKTYKETGLFRFWCQHVLPAVYDDSLSYYELLCKVVQYLNDVISNMDTAIDNIQALYDAYAELQTWVNNYFDNLDAQALIDNKLDKMIADGTFTEIIRPYIASDTSQWLAENVSQWSGALDKSLSIENMGADSKATGDAIKQTNEDIAIMSEPTKNLNNIPMGRFGSANDGKIYPRDALYYGMEFCKYLEGDKTYSFSCGGISSENDISCTVMVLNGDGTFSRRFAFANANPHSVTLSETERYLHVFYQSNSTITLDNAYLQIEEGTLATSYEPALSAKDWYLRKDFEARDEILMDNVGAMCDCAEGYLAKAYAEPPNLVYDSTKGLFSLDIYSSYAGESNYPAIVCSQFLMAILKGIPYDQSRYEQNLNHMAGWGFISDGIEHPIEGDPTYYAYLEGTVIDTDDIPSYDYMYSYEIYRYCKDRGWVFPIDTIRRKVNPGDIVFMATEGAGGYDDVHHCALVLQVGYDDNRMVIVDSSDARYNNRRIGCSIRSIGINTFQYVAKLPRAEAPHVVRKVFEDNDISGTGSGTIKQWYTPTQWYDAGIYTCIVEGELPYTAFPFIGTRFENDDTTTQHRMVNSGNKHIVTFYAPKRFNFLSIVLSNSDDYDIDSIKLYKGHII